MFIRFPTKVFQLYSRFARGKTLGARVAVFDEQGRVLLVRMGYAPGWFMPGGGVDPGETLREAAIRELHEEAAIEPTAPLQFHGMFSNEKVFRGDHVALFICRQFRQLSFKPTTEIPEIGFFAMDALPEGTKQSVKARLDEIVHGAPVSDHWVP